MDDGYVFCENKEKAWEIIGEIKRISVILGLEVHPKKTKIMNITKEVVFLKRCYK